MKPRIIFDIITLFPEIFTAYLNESVIGRAIRKGLVKVRVHNLRGFTTAPHHKADDRPYGGGPGMVLKAEPITKAMRQLKLRPGKRAKAILLSAAGKQFSDKEAIRLARSSRRIVLIAGHYEGVDERVKKIFKPEEISIGPYVLTGGELPALIVIDAVSRKVKGVLGKEESLEEKRYGVGVPAYTRPETLTYSGKKYAVPKVLLSGHHGEIKRWRLGHKPRSEFLTGLRQNSILRNKMPVKNLLRGKKR